MNYLGRPVFEFLVNWADPVNKSFTYDLKQIALGFGSEYFTSLQNNVVQGWDVSLDLTTATDINAFDSFFNAISGRLVGFWFPGRLLAGDFISVNIDVVHIVSTIKIKAQGLADTWDDHPDIHLYLTNGTQTFAVQIHDVTDNGDGTETITVQADLTPIPAPFVIYRLHYVRLADDTEKATFVDNNWQKRSLKVVELPEEYTNIETGQQPIYLYHFWMQSPVITDWYYTSFAGDVISGNKTYSAFPIEHGSLTNNSRGDAESLDISAKYDANHPLALYLPLAPARPLNVEVVEVSCTDLETQIKRFVGQVRTVEDEGEKVVAHCDSFLQILGRKCPRHVIGPTCGYNLFDSKTCKVSRFQYQVEAIIQSLGAFDGHAPQAITLTFPTVPALLNYAFGFIESGTAKHYEMRTVLSSGWNAGTQVLTITVNAPLLHANVGDSILIAPGCDGTANDCKTKFNNYVNFGGFPFVPIDNPTIASVQNNVAAGGKK